MHRKERIFTVDEATASLARAVARHADNLLWRKDKVLVLMLSRGLSRDALGPLVDPIQAEVDRHAAYLSARLPPGTDRTLLVTPDAATGLARLGLEPDGRLACADEAAFFASPLAGALAAAHPVWSVLPERASIEAGEHWARSHGDDPAQRGAADALLAATRARRVRWRWFALMEVHANFGRDRSWRVGRACEAAQRGLVELFDAAALPVAELDLPARMREALIAGIEACGTVAELGRLPSVWTMMDFRGVGSGTIERLTEAMVAEARARYGAEAKPLPADPSGTDALDSGLDALAAMFS